MELLRKPRVRVVIDAAEDVGYDLGSSLGWDTVSISNFLREFVGEFADSLVLCVVGVVGHFVILHPAKGLLGHSL